jgi:hypothetical protein
MPKRGRAYALDALRVPHVLVHLHAAVQRAVQQEEVVVAAQAQVLVHAHVHVRAVNEALQGGFVEVVVGVRPGRALRRLRGRHGLLRWPFRVLCCIPPIPHPQQASVWVGCRLELCGGYSRGCAHTRSTVHQCAGVQPRERVQCALTRSTVHPPSHPATHACTHTHTQTHSHTPAAPAAARALACAAVSSFSLLFSAATSAARAAILASASAFASFCCCSCSSCLAVSDGRVSPSGPPPEVCV